MSSLRVAPPVSIRTEYPENKTTTKSENEARLRVFESSIQQTCYLSEFLIIRIESKHNAQPKLPASEILGACACMFLQVRTTFSNTANCEMVLFPECSTDERICSLTAKSLFQELKCRKTMN